MTGSQGCQMKISMKDQTVPKKAKKRPNRSFKGQKKAKLCDIAIPLLQKTRQ